MVTVAGVHWSLPTADLQHLPQIGGLQAAQVMREAIPQLAYDAARLEGNPASPADVRALHAGRPVALPVDARIQVQHLLEAHALLVQLVERGQFSLSKSVADALHGIVARNEAIEAGHFRGEGTVLGGGAVRLTDGSVVEGTPAGPAGGHLRTIYADAITALLGLPDRREQALGYFAVATRHQAYFDGNKRAARMMLNGQLVAAGYPPISVPPGQASAYFRALDRLFRDNDGSPVLRLLAAHPLPHAAGGGGAGW